MSDLPRLLITMGDVAGVGPEVIARAWPDLLGVCVPTVVGDPAWLEMAMQLIGGSSQVASIKEVGEEAPSPEVIPCLVATRQDLSAASPGAVSAAAGKAAYDFLLAAVDRVVADEADGVVTAPLNKESLRAAGIPHPGHTEILAARTRVKNYAMVLYGDDLAVAHVTLHMALRDVFKHLSIDAVLDKIRLLDGLLPRLIGRPARLAVAALNPHASEGGLFGDEEARILTPAVERALEDDIEVTGPLPADTVFSRAHRGEFDGVVAPYHDQGHIAMKLRSGFRCVNITAGLPIVRTSVAHGTGYDIAWRGLADASSLVEAARVAAKLATEASPE
jgi:4-hydroxythreonine-4-phosphate dehydrogenase